MSGEPKGIELVAYVFIVPLCRPCINQNDTVEYCPSFIFEREIKVDILANAQNEKTNTKGRSRERVKERSKDASVTPSPHRRFSDSILNVSPGNKTAIITLIAFLVMQTVIFAAIPKDMDAAKHTVIIKNGMKLSAIARMLEDEGLIYSPQLFIATSLLYRGKLIAGEYTLTKNMSTFDIVRKMGRSERNIYTLKIVEGHNIFTIAESISAAGIMDHDEFLRLASDTEFLKQLGIHSDSLEGYLWPDTYYYSKEIDAQKFVEKIAKRTLKLFEEDNIKARMSAMGLDMERTLTLASMIEKEARVSAEKPLISAVFHNRLTKRMSFDSDPTVIYGTKGFHRPISKTDLITHTPYNTYTFRGFPKGPICNPDKSSITAALNPARVDYLFFVSRNDGTHVFSNTLNEHNRYVNMYQRPQKRQ